MRSACEPKEAHATLLYSLLYQNWYSVAGLNVPTCVAALLHTMHCIHHHPNATLFAWSQCLHHCLHHCAQATIVSGQLPASNGDCVQLQQQQSHSALLTLCSLSIINSNSTLFDANYLCWVLSNSRHFLHCSPRVSIINPIHQLVVPFLVAICTVSYNCNNSSCAQSWQPVHNATTAATGFGWPDCASSHHAKKIVWHRQLLP